MATNRNLDQNSSAVDAYETPTARKNRGMTQLTVTLGAGIPQRFELTGDYFHVYTAPVNDLMVRFDDGKKAQMQESVGKRIYYSEFELSSATGQSVVVEYGFGSVFDGRASANVNVTTSLQPGNTINDGGKVSCVHNVATQLLAADPDRLYANITNLSSNTLTMYIGTSSVDATRGTPLEPGTTLPFPTTAAIYAFNADVAVDQYLYAASIKQV